MTKVILKKCNNIRRRKIYIFWEITQFRELETIIKVHEKPHLTRFENLEFTSLEWLNFDSLKIELIQFKESAVWKNNFIYLNLELEEINYVADVRC
jgi:hypothetical protein